MAAFSAGWSRWRLVCFFLCVTPIISLENFTSSDNSTAAPAEQNFTSTPSHYYTELQSPAPSGSVEPPVPAEPLPVSGLPTPETSVSGLCPCDELPAGCDADCCCDRDCPEEVPLFTSCSISAVSSGSKQLCSWSTAQYSVRTTADGYSELQSAVQEEANQDVFCIQSHSSMDGFSFPSPALPLESTFNSLCNLFSSFVFGPDSIDQMPSADVQTSPGYQYGDVLETAEPSGLRGRFSLPAPGVTADCLNNSPAVFLQDQNSGCSQRVVLNQDCSSLPALSMDTYTNIQLFAGKNADAAVVTVGVLSVILQSPEGAQTVSDGENLLPVLLGPSLCVNVVLKVVYVIKYNSAGGLVNVSVSLVLGSVLEAAVVLKQEFQLIYIQEDGGDVEVQFSGNPGYVVGLPVVSGKRTTDGISRSVNLKDTLSLLQVSAEDQDCLLGPHQRSPVLFGLDSVSGCTIRLEDIVDCSLVSQLLLEVLRGPDYPLDVASFGNPLLDSYLDWVQIKTSTSPTDAQSCSIPLSRHLEIEWTKYGAMTNPQARIVSIKEVIQTNSSSLLLLSGGSSVLPIRSSVAFVSVSAAALPGFRAMPSIDAKLPFDFFFPFV